MADVLLARALNGTIGTPNFKGFNEIYEENIKNVRLVGSNEVFFVYDGVFSSTDGQYTMKKYISFDVNGSVNANAYVRFYNSSASSVSASFNLKVLDESGKTIHEKNFTSSIGDRTYSNEEDVISFNVSKGSKYKISVESESNTISVNTVIISINASIVPATSFCTLMD